MITVEGYSGCEVRIIKKGPTEYVVEKGSNDPDYVPRLLKQRDKQMAAYVANTFPNVVIPRILYTKQLTLEDHTASYSEKGACSVHASTPKSQACVIGMPFYHHTDTISFLSRASMDEVKLFSDCLLDTIDQNIRRCCGNNTVNSRTAAGPKHLDLDQIGAKGNKCDEDYTSTSPCEIATFKEKLIDIVRVCTKNKHIQAMESESTGLFRIGGDGSSGPLSRIRDVIVPALIEYLGRMAIKDGQCPIRNENENKRADNGAGHIHIPLGACHGDFTLSNVLILTPHPNEPSMSFTVPVVDNTNSTEMPTNRFVSPMSPFTTAASPSGSRSSGSFRIALIDFLDSFVESPLADMAKICQDLKYGWTLRLLSTPKRGANASPSSQGGTPSESLPSISLRSPEERAIFSKLSDVDATKPAPVSRAAALRRQRLLFSTAKEIIRDTAAIGDRGGSSGSADGFAESLQSAAVQVFAAMHHIYEDMLRRYARHSWFRDYFLVFFIMNQLRVLQYAKDVDAGLYLYRSVEEEFKIFSQHDGRMVV